MKFAGGWKDCDCEGGRCMWCIGVYGRQVCAIEYVGAEGVELCVMATDDAKAADGVGAEGSAADGSSSGDGSSSAGGGGRDSMSREGVSARARMARMAF